MVLRYSINFSHHFREKKFTSLTPEFIYMDWTGPKVLTFVGSTLKSDQPLTHDFHVKTPCQSDLTRGVSKISKYIKPF